MNIEHLNVVNYKSAYRCIEQLLIYLFRKKHFKKYLNKLFKMISIKLKNTLSLQKRKKKLLKRRKSLKKKQREKKMRKEKVPLLFLLKWLGISLPSILRHKYLKLSKRSGKSKSLEFMLTQQKYAPALKSLKSLAQMKKRNLLLLKKKKLNSLIILKVNMVKCQEIVLSIKISQMTIS